VGSAILTDAGRAPWFKSEVLRLRAMAALALLCGWQLVSMSGLVMREILPPPSEIVLAAIRLCGQPTFYLHLVTTFLEIIASVAIGLVGAVLVASLCGAFATVRQGLSPLLYYLAPTPKIIFFPIALGLFGVDLGSKIAIGALSAFFPIAISIVAGLTQIDRIFLDVARSFNLSLRQTALKIYVPCLWGAALTGLRLGIGLGIIGVLLSETKLASHGLGFLAIQAYNSFRVADLYAVILITFILAAALNGVVSVLEGRRRMSDRDA
jgi:NitT/TauT family transport system permease protein